MLPFPVTFSTFLHLALRFWNHTCRERGLRSLGNGAETETLALPVT